MEAKKSGKISPIFAIIMVIGVVFIIYQFILKPAQNANGNANTVDGDKKVVDTNTGTPTEPATAIKTPANDIVYEWKAIPMSGDRVRWIQDGYNRYAKNKRTYGQSESTNTPALEWVAIPVDGQFGKKTHDAVRKVMTNTGKASWTQFKARLINVCSINFPNHPIY
jgi:hypothetical protein